MAVSPLEGLMAIAVLQAPAGDQHQLVFSSVEEPGGQQPCAASSPASLRRARQRARSSSSRSSSRESRKWACPPLQVHPAHGSRPTSGSGCCPEVQSKMLRSHHSPENAARERSRVRNLRQAFHSLQAALPSVPPHTKLSKLDVLVLATNYIAYLTETLDQGGLVAEQTLLSRSGGYLHPVKKWPMRSLLYCGSMGELLSGVSANQTASFGHEGTHPVTPASEAE